MEILPKSGALVAVPKCTVESLLKTATAILKLIHK